MAKGRIIIGSNWGDEGKGTVVAHYAKNATGKVLNVLTNGGPQRGHTVVKDGEVFTFKHFGSGMCFGADIYFSKDFIVNPHAIRQGICKAGPEAAYVQYIHA